MKLPPPMITPPLNPQPEGPRRRTSLLGMLVFAFLFLVVCGGFFLLASAISH
jgi:hypothetical protein